MAHTDYRIDTDSPAGGDLLFWSLIGHEALSRPSVYELTVLSTNPDIQPADILGRGFDVVIGFEDAEGTPHERHCQGVAVRFARLHALGRYHEYRIELRSWFWLLHKRRNSRILGDDKDEGAAKNALEILDIVLENSPIRAIKKLKKNGLGAHEARGYSVQYEESDYNYLSRLLEDEGIYYWFDAHAEPGTMRLADNSAVAHDPLPVVPELHHALGGASEARFNEIWRWESERKLDTGWFDTRDSNYRTIRTKLGAIGGDLEEHELADFEEFEYPGGLMDRAAADVVLANRVDELRSRRERHWALTGWPDVAPGRSFTYEGDPDPAHNGKYLIGGCVVVCVHPGHESVPRPPSDVRAVRRLLDRALEGDAVNGDTADTLRRLVDSTPLLHELVVGSCAFLMTTWPLSVPYKPPRLTPRVRMPGPQTAIVVGAKGEEIPENGEDLYVDVHGRVKVFFHWNRYEKDKKDFDGQKWSAWLRVSQPWAGKKWGGYFAPRIGQEVIVDFLDGDPDRPLIVGRVYNDDQEIPYTSPTQSGFKTRSTPNGKPANYNEIMFEDKKGQENLNIHAERNMSRSVELDDSTGVGRDQSISIKNKQTTSVGTFRSVTVEDGDEKYTVNGDRTTYVKGVDKLTVDANRSITVKSGQHTTITSGEHKLEVKGGDKNSFVTGNQKTWVSSGYTLMAKTGTITIGTNLSVKADNMLLESSSTRTDSTTGAHKITATSTLDTFAPDVIHSAANKMDIVAGTNLLVSGIVDTTITSAKVSITSTGPQKDATLGLFSKLTLGMENKNNIGLVSAGVLGLKSETIAGLAVKQMALKVNDASLHVLKPGAPAAAAGMFEKIAGVVNFIAPFFQAISAGVAASGGISTQSSSLKNAEQKLNEAADRMNALNPELAKKLRKLASDAKDRAQREKYKEYGATGVAVAGAALGIAATVVGVKSAGVLAEEAAKKAAEAAAKKAAEEAAKKAAEEAAKKAAEAAAKKAAEEAAKKAAEETAKKAAEEAAKKAAEEAAKKAAEETAKKAAEEAAKKAAEEAAKKAASGNTLPGLGPLPKP